GPPAAARPPGSTPAALAAAACHAAARRSASSAPPAANLHTGGSRTGRSCRNHAGSQTTSQRLARDQTCPTLLAHAAEERDASPRHPRGIRSAMCYASQHREVAPAAHPPSDGNGRNVGRKRFLGLVHLTQVTLLSG